MNQTWENYRKASSVVTKARDMRILVVQETDWIQNLPLQSHQIFEALSRKGHEVRVIDYEARWSRQSPVISIRTRRIADAVRTDGQSKVCLIRPGLVRIPGVSRLTSFATHFKVIFEQMAKWADLVVLYSVPTNGIQTIISSKLNDKPVIFHSFDVLHRMTGYNLLRPPTWALERLVYRNADKLVAISVSLRDYLIEIGVPANKILLLPPAVDINKFRPLDENDFRRKVGLTAEDKIVLFSGWLYEFSGLDIVVSQFEKIVRRVPRARLVICGDGPAKAKLASLRDELRLDSTVLILDRQPYNAMPAVIDGSDVCINPYLADIRANFAFPSKIAEYMSCGKPVLATDLPGTRSFLEGCPGALLVPISSFMDSLADLLSNDQQLAATGVAARHFAEKNFSLESISLRFEQIMHELFERWTRERT